MSIMDSPVPTGNAPGCAKRWRPAATETPSSLPSLTGSPDRSQTPERSWKSSRHVRSSSVWVVHDPNDPVGRLLFNVLAMVAEFESDLIRLRTREGMQVAKAKGRLRGKQPKLNARQETHLVALFNAGEHSIGELNELFGVARSTVYRAVEREKVRTRAVSEETTLRLQPILNRT